MFDRDRNANSCSSNGVRPVHRQKKKIRKKKREKRAGGRKSGEKNKMKQKKKKLYNMITSDIKKLLFSPGCRLVQEPHTEAGLERRWGGTIVITIRRKKNR